MATHLKTNELLLAARKGDYKLVSSLIALHGKSLMNSQDHLGTSALHLAVIHGHTKIVKILISQSGINTNLQAYKDNQQGHSYSPLDMAIKYSQPIEMVQILLEAGASSKYPTHLLLMLFDKGFESELVNCEQKLNFTAFQNTINILDLLLKNIPSMAYIQGTPISSILYQMNCYIADPNEKVLMQQMIEILLVHDINHFEHGFITAKNFTHAFPSNKQYATINSYSKDAVSAEGHFSVFTVKSFHDSILDYQHNLNEETSILKKNIFSEVNASFYIAERAILNAGSYDVSKMLFALYEDGATLLLPTGWEGHAIDIILDKSLGLYVVANAGERYMTLPSGVNAYNHHSPISEEDIYKILNNQEKFNLEYDHYYDLSLSKNSEFSEIFADQLYGNCALNSLLLSNWSLTYIFLYKSLNNPTLAKKMADSWHQDMIEHHKTLTLKNYLSDPYFKDDRPLYDVLIKYESKLDHPEKIEQAHLILDFLSSPEHLSGFKHFYKKHQADFTPELKQFIQQNGYGKTIQLGDVLSNFHPMQDKILPSFLEAELFPVPIQTLDNIFNQTILYPDL